jgi:tight adherence protein B
MNTTLAAIAAIAGAATVYFAVEWVAATVRRRNMTYLERTALDVEDDARDSRSAFTPLWRILDEFGWYGDPALPVLGVAAVYLAVAAALKTVGVGGLVGTLVALPVSVGVVRQLLGTLRRRRQRQFNRQLVQALELLAGQMEAGNGVQRSLEMMTPSLPDPLRSEFETALEATVASKDLVDALRDVGGRYPSKALALFITALDIERMTSGQLGRPVREAADLMRREFELSGELSAETAQQKLAAIVMVLGITGICAALIAGLDTEAFTSPLGFTLLAVGGANFVFGIHRVAKMLRSIEGGV